MTPGSSSRKRGARKVDSPSSPPQAKISKGIHPFFRKPAERPPASFSWRKTIGDTCMHGVHLDPVLSHKVAAFDLDGCLIKTKSGNQFPRDKEDWVWWRTCVPKKLKALHDEGFAIVIVSNQASTKKNTVEQWKQKMPLIADQISNVPFRIFAASGHDGFRKPMPGIWTEFEKINQDVIIDKTLSFFVGDAAGRPRDHNDSDRKWALNVGIPFFTPEEYFLGDAPAAYTLKGFNPSTRAMDSPLFTPTSSPLVPIPSKDAELVIFVGYPASGKTGLYRRYFQPAGYEHVNQDSLKTRSKCTKTVENLLKEGKCCVVDNTNRSVATRKEYLDICKRLGLPARCIIFETPLELCWHNNLYRAFCLSPAQQTREDTRALLPQIAFTSFRANYEEPTMAEGFSEIKRVNWLFEGTEEDRKRWSMWLEIDKIAWLSG